MFDAVIKQTILSLWVSGIRDENAALLFWDYQYMYKFGLFEIPDLIPDPEMPPIPLPQPQPDPLPIERLRINEEILFGLIDLFNETQTSQSSIAKVLRNNEIRLKAAKTVSQRLNTAMKGLDQEIERLEKQL